MCQDCDSEHWEEVIEGILDNGPSDSDQRFLEGVAEWIGDNGHATEAQIEKIKEKADAIGVEY